MSSFLAPTLEAYSLARSAFFQSQGLLGPLVERFVGGEWPKSALTNPQLFKDARKAAFDLMKQDIQNISDGLYPVEVLKPKNPLKTVLRIPRLMKEVVQLSRRRKAKAAHTFSEKAQPLLQGLPEYYQRNFHFQDDGYLSDRSAELYEHQVEILFAGSADAMRRLIIKPLKEKFASNPTGEGLTFLEIGAGTGRATRFVRLAFPKAKIVAVDLSVPYLRRAQSELAEFDHHDFNEANGSDLPFKDETFDAVYSIFLFHELPRDERDAVIRESNRVLKAGGFHGLVDSLQLGDVPTFDEALELFPQNFHEPFYKNYIQTPIQDVLVASGVKLTNVSTGFFSKCVTGQKAATL